VAYEARVITRIEAPVDEVWQWMSDARNVLSANIFHDPIEWEEPITEAGPRIPVPHTYFGVIKQRRVAHVRDYRKYFVGFGETKARDEPGVDPFPHYQSFELAPLSDDTCLLVNYMRGVYQFRGAKYIGERIFKRWMPPILLDDNANIAIAVGAMDPEDKPRLKGSLRLLPLFVRDARHQRGKRYPRGKAATGRR
jgi:hypothetical protein